MYTSLNLLVVQCTIVSKYESQLRMTCGKAPPLANTPASGSRQAAQLSLRYKGPLDHLPLASAC